MKLIAAILLSQIWSLTPEPLPVLDWSLDSSQQEMEVISSTVSVDAPAEKAEKPLLQIWSQSTGCAPCNRLKADIQAGRLFGFRVQWMTGNPPERRGFPTICFAGEYTTGWPVSDAERLGRIRQLKEAAGIESESVQATVKQSLLVQPYQPVRSPIVDTPWGRINLNTYQRNCNCPMCQGIRALQQQYRQTAIIKTPTEPGQEPTPDATLRHMVDELRLTQNDILADLGCGDGRVLIAAYRKYGCRGIGVEIDPVKADEARANIARENLSEAIRVITGDALEFSPREHGVTAITAYLYPDLLEKLQGQLHQARVVITPFHRPSNLEMVQRGDLWVHRKVMQEEIKSRRTQLTSCPGGTCPPQRRMRFGGLFR